MLKTFSILLAVTICFSCTRSADKANSTTGKNDSVPVVQSEKTDIPPEASPSGEQINVQNGNEMHLAFAPGSTSLKVKGKLDKAGAKLTCYLPVTTGSKLNALLIPAKQPVNIRFNQIILPDGSANGPLGQMLESDLSQKGTYQIIISHNLMAEDPYLGEFELLLNLK